MPYRIEWEPKGAVKLYRGDVTFQDIYQSECDIQSAPEFDNLRYVLSVFEGNSGTALSKSESDLILALRLGAMNTNSRIKYAYVSNDDKARGQIGESIKKSNSVFPVQMFDNIQDAMVWAKS